MIRAPVARRGTRSRLVREAVNRQADGGTSRSFEELYREERGSVLALAYALSGNRWVAEELAQEAFLVAHRNWARISNFDDPGAWVRRVAANMSASAFRRRLAEARALSRASTGRPPAVPELSADAAEFWEAVRSLPRRRAQVVALYYLEDRPVAEIARILGMAQGTVKKSLHDGRRALAQILELESGEGSS
jgi:RNA polymerase sigma-70 factor (ECF subfamily)